MDPTTPFREGGVGMYVLLALTIAGYVVSGLGILAVALVKRPASGFVVGAMLCAFSLCTGLATAGFWSSEQSKVERAIAIIEPENRDYFRNEAYRELSWLPTLGSCGCVPVGAAAIAALAVGVARRSRVRAAP